MNAPPRIAVVRMDNLGDHVLGSGLLDALRTLHPAAKIRMVVPAGLADLYARCPLHSELMLLPSHETYCKDPDLRDGLVKHVAAGEKFDLVVSPRFAGDYYFAGMICEALGSATSRRIGFLQVDSPYEDYDANECFTELLEAPEDLHASRYAGRIAEHLSMDSGKVVGSVDPVVWYSVEDVERVGRRWPAGDRPWVALGCGASFPFKLPEPSVMVHVVDRLVNTWGQRVILVGSKADEEFAAPILAAFPGHHDVQSAIGELKLYETSALLSQARLYVGPDSGPMHMAAAVGIPVIELDWVPEGYPAKSRGPLTAGRCWEPWARRGISVRPDPARFAAQRESAGFASEFSKGISLGDVDRALRTMLSD